MDVIERLLHTVGPRFEEIEGELEALAFILWGCR
jgi:hypothetical protein